MKRGAVELMESAADEVMDVFFVPKAAARVRMVTDCRHSRRHFAGPALVGLSSGASCAGLDKDEWLEAVCGAGRREGHVLQNGTSARVEEVLGRASRRRALARTSGGGRAKVRLPALARLRALPMGWTWALWCRRSEECPSGWRRGHGWCGFFPMRGTPTTSWCSGT